MWRKAMKPIGPASVWKHDTWRRRAGSVDRNGSFGSETFTLLFSAVPFNLWPFAVTCLELDLRPRTPLSPSLLSEPFRQPLKERYKKADKEEASA